MKYLESSILMLMLLSDTIVFGSQNMQSFGGISVAVCASAANASNQVSNAQSVQTAMPPMSASLDPKRLIRFFCRMWKDEDYSAMYLCMSRQYQRQVSLEKFASLFEADADITGGLEDENILAEDGENGAGHLVVVDLKFRRKRAPNRRVRAMLEKSKDGYRLIKSGILPLDFGNL